MSDEPVWAIVELMGHVRLAGRLSEEEKFGGKLGRIDIPVPDGADFVTQYFGAGSVYRITVVSEDVARHVARGNVPQPVSPWDFPKQLKAADHLAPTCSNCHRATHPRCDNGRCGVCCEDNCERDCGRSREMSGLDEQEGD